MSAPSISRFGDPTRPAVVALGGGHGLSASLSALRLMTDRITAVVTVADDGGSSGRLREEMGVLPPGDLRMALSALCDDSDWGRTWRDLLQHRFATNGPLDRHSVGNLLIVALWELLGDTVGGLDLVGRLLGARGRVLPMAAVPLCIEADVRTADGRHEVVRGQTQVALTSHRIEHLRLHPADPPACPEAVKALREADWVVIGPGSWYSSVLPHLLVPQLREALVETTARVIVTLNLTPDDETEGMRAVDHLEVLRSHAPELSLHAVVADPAALDDVGELAELCAEMGCRLLVRQVGRGDQSAVHDPLRLAAALRDVVEDYLGDVGTRAGLPPMSHDTDG